jgi:Domain of unknown function (DUF4173)
MNTTTAESTSSTITLRRAAAVLAPVGLTTALADFLFWRGGVGLSIGVFFAIRGVMLLATLRKRPRARLLLVAAMLLACSVQSAIEVSLSNILVCIALTAALAGEVYQPHLAGFWARLSEVVFGFVTAPFRWLGVAGNVARGLAEQRVVNFNVAEQGARVVWVLAPAVFLVIVFAIIFGTGNAIFANLLSSAETRAWDWFTTLDLSPVRFLLWGLVATLALGIFHGTRAPESPRWWTLIFPRLPRPDHRLAMWQSAAILITLNGLFCVVNTIDAIYLWSQGSLPAGVNRSAFVHDGVNSLMVAVVLSALIIAGIFQQEDRAAGHRWLKNLAHLWVVQNCVLIAGVLLRLKLYTDDYMLTEKRVHVACFLALVSAGFVVLGWFVEKRRSFNWLLGRNAVATFLLFFIVQFPDVAGFVARYNVERWQAGAAKTVDVAHLAALGPGAWVPLQTVANSTRSFELAEIARSKLELALDEDRAADRDWRTWQARREWARQALTYNARSGAGAGRTRAE